MKKLLFLLLMMVSPPSFAQNNSIWLEKGIGDALAVAEFKDIPNDNVFNYLYVELDISKYNNTRSTYILVSRDQKWWNKKVWIHGEFRSFVGKNFSTENIYLLGPMVELVGGKYGFLNLQALYRHDSKVTYQITFLSDVEYKRFYYSMFADTYGTDDGVSIHSENRFFFKVVPHVRVGANILITSKEGNGDFYVKPMAVLRVDL